MISKRTLLLLIATVVIVLLFSLFFTNNFIRRSIGKAVMYTGTSLRIGDEEPIEPAPPSGGGGGGGGGAPEIKTDFVLDKNLIIVLLKQGGSQERTVRISNTGGTTLEIDVRSRNLERFIVIDVESFSLRPGDFKKIKLDFFAREDEVPDVYTGKIVIRGEGVVKTINVIIEVKKREPLFNTTTEVIEKELRPMDDVQANISISNYGDLEYADILLYYAIKDFEGKVLTYREESLVIEKELNITRSLKIPQGIPEGDYIFYSRVSYEDVITTGSDVFEVVSEEELPAPVITFPIFVLVMLIIALILVLFIRKRLKKPIEKDKARESTRKFHD